MIPLRQSWDQPTRQLYGAWLVDQKRGVDAERVYREDLVRNPENGWSLFGLKQALEAQGKTAEAAAVAERFRKAWKDADVTLTSARLR